MPGVRTKREIKNRQHDIIKQFIYHSLFPCQETPRSISDLHPSLYPTLPKTPTLVPPPIVFHFSASLV
jgi:hypothetical protein